MSKARDLADFQGSASALTTGTLPVDRVPYVGRRNLIINGGFDVWQRGTSFDIVTSAYHADRWRGRDATISRSTDVPANEGFKYSVFYDNDGVRSGINIRQIIEDGKRYTDNKEITLSFWIKGSIASNNCSVDFGDQQNTFFSLTTEWNRVVITVPAYVRNTNNNFVGGLYVDFNLGTDYPDVYITGVQLELGSVATPFEHRSYGEELALCQRYFQITNNPYSTWGNSAGYASWCVDFATEMRASPTVTAYQANGVFFSGPIVTSRGIDVLLQSQNTGSAHKLGYNCDAEL